MRNRLISLLLAFLMVFVMAAKIAPKAQAVAPVGLGAAVVFSFLWSAGIELWRDGADGDMSPQESMQAAISDLWSDYRSDGHSEAMSLESMEGSISFDKFGRAVVANQLSLQLGDFVKWLSEKFSFKPGTTKALTDESPSGSALLFTMPESEVESLAGYNSVWALPVSATTSSPVYVEFQRLSKKFRIESNPVSYMFIMSDKPNIIHYCSTNEFTLTNQELNMDGEEVGSPQYIYSIGRTYQNVSRPNSGNDFVFYDQQQSYSASYGPSLTPSPPANGIGNLGNSNAPLLAIEYIILAGDAVGGSEDLFANIGLSVLDNVYDTLQDQAIAIDIGLTGTEENKEEAFIGESAGAFIGGKDAALEYSAVATPVPVEGVQELYPTVDDLITDVEGLEVPSLGHALATRFPFCIPFDVNYLFKSLSASPKRPVFEIDVIPQSMKTKIGITQKTSFTVDFGDERFSLLLKLIRWGCLFGFILWLALITKRLIWTTGG